MRKRIFAVVLAAALALSVCGCGEENKPADGSVQGGSVGQGGGTTQGGAGSGTVSVEGVDMQVVIYSSKRADFIIEDAYVDQNSEEQQCRVMFDSPVGNFQIALGGMGSYQCCIDRETSSGNDQRTGEILGSCEYRYEGDQVTISVNMSDYDIQGFDFHKVEEYKVTKLTEYNYVEATLLAANVVKEKAEGADCLPYQMTVVVYSDKKADFIIEDAYFEPGSKGSCSVEFALQDGNYKVGLNDFGGKTLQCSLYRQSEEDPNRYDVVGSCSHSYDGNQLTLSVNLGDFGIKGSFQDVAEYELANGAQGKGFAPVTFAAANVVKEGAGGVGDGGEPVDDGPMDDGQPKRYENLDYAYNGNGGVTILSGTCNQIPSSIDGRPVTEIQGVRFFSDYQSSFQVVIPDSVTTIGENAFHNDDNIESITIPDSVTFIGDGAFIGCSSLKSIVIPGSVESIGNSTFSRCRSLAGVTIQEGVKSIGEHAFSECDSLRSIDIPGSVETIGKSAFAGLENLTSLTLGEGIKEIGESAFAWSGITSVILPESLETYGDAVFRECRSLASVTIPGSMETVGGYMFMYCEGLISVTIPEGVTSVEDGAFEACTGITSVSLPTSLRTIGYSAFTSIGCSGITIPDGVTSIGGGAFANSQLVSIIIPDGVTQIGDYAFSDCGRLASVTVPDSVESIGTCAFSFCPSLKSISLPGGVKMGERVFEYSPTAVTYR